MINLTKKEFIQSFIILTTIELWDREDTKKNIRLFQSNLRKALEDLSDVDLYYLAGSQQINII